MEKSDLVEAVSRLDSGQNTLYALVDHAGAPGLLNRLNEYPTTTWTNLFSGSHEESAIEAAPLLITLQPPLRDFWLHWLYTACRESTSLTLLYSDADHQALANSLKKRLDVMLPDGVPALLRYFDTRILESLLHSLELEQRAIFLGIACHWIWLTRAGNLKTLETASTHEDSWPSPFSFSEHQQNLMIEAAEADVLVQQMQTYGSDLCKARSRAELHAIASTALNSTKEYGIEGMPSQTLFGLACLKLGSNFIAGPEWKELLQRIRNKECSFEDAIQQKGL